MTRLKGMSSALFFCAGCTHFSLSFNIWQALDNASNITVASLLGGPNAPQKNPCLLWPLCPWPGVLRCALLPECCALQSTSHSHGSLSLDRVFLTGYKWRQTQRQLHAPLSNSELSTFTFHQPTRTAKALAYVNLLSPIVQKSTYSVWEINIPNIVWDSGGMW